MMTFHCDAGEVRRLLPEAGEAVEEGGLPAVRWTHQSNGGALPDALAPPARPGGEVAPRWLEFP